MLPGGLQSQKNQTNKGLATEITENTESLKQEVLRVLCDLCGQSSLLLRDFADLRPEVKRGGQVSCKVLF